jgi:hypothetical protein
MIRNLIVFSHLFCLSFHAFPCSLVGTEHDIEFDPQSAALGSRNARELADWFIEKRESIGIEDISILGISMKNNPRSLALSRERMHNIARIIDPLNKNNVSVKLVDHLKVSPPVAPPFHPDFTSVVIQATCIKTGTCCPVLRERPGTVLPNLLEIASKMPEKFIVAFYQNTFPDKNEAIFSIKKILANRDRVRSSDDETRLLEQITPIKLNNGAELFKLLTWWYVVAPNKQGGFNLLSSGTGSDFRTLDEAKDFMSTSFKAPGDAEKLFIFEREDAEQAPK